MKKKKINLAPDNGARLNAVEVARKYGLKLANYGRENKEYDEIMEEVNSVEMLDLKKKKYGKVYDYLKESDLTFAISCDEWARKKMMHSQEATDKSTTAKGEKK